MNKQQETTAIDEAVKTTTAVGAATEPEVYGFEETEAKDLVIPRIKVINALSPERTDGIAAEGDIVNSLTKDIVFKMDGTITNVFVPLKQYYSNIEWNPDRNGDPRIFCYSPDGKIGTTCDGETKACANCKRNQFDNTKTGKDAQPLCTSYLNFLGFIEGDMMPIVLSFAKTNYNEGKKMLTIAKSMGCSIFNFGYILKGKKVTKDKNTWFIIETALGAETSEGTRALAKQLFKAYSTVAAIKADYEDASYNAPAPENTERTDAMASEI